MPPSTQTQQTVSKGPATPEEKTAFELSLSQGNTATLAARNALFDPRQQLAQFDATKQQSLDRIAALNAEYARIESGESWQAGEGKGRRDLIPGLIAQEKANLQSLEASRPFLEKQAARIEDQETQNKRVQQRISDFIEGRDLGVSPEERSLITQGISGISQDVATTRGLNRTDVPVMQAIAPTVANSLLAQANANRSLFTGINQFQQGLDLSNRQLQLGLAGQNPAANLTGVYSGLRSTSMSGSTQQNYGAADYVGMVGGGAAGIGLGAYGLSKAFGGRPPTKNTGQVDAGSDYSGLDFTGVG